MRLGHQNGADRMLLGVTQIVDRDRDWQKTFAQVPNALGVALARDTSLEIVYSEKSWNLMRSSGTERR